ncbi:hypothetical protein D3C76_799890 [compost metagenome]
MLKARQVTLQGGGLARPGLFVETEEHVDLHDRADDLVVIKNQRVGRADAVPGAHQQERQDQAGDADPQQVHQQVRRAELDAGDQSNGQAQQAGPHRHALVEQHHAGEQPQAANAQAQGP